MDLVHIITDVLPVVGVGGLLGLVMFYFYRQDRADTATKFETILKQQDQNYSEIVARQEKASEGWVKIVQDNTAAITRLTERLPGR